MCFVLLLLAAPTRAQTPSPDDTLRAFRIVERHIRDWSLPDDTGAEKDTLKAVGACVTLKLHGDVIARGAAWSDTIAGPEAYTTTVLARAIRAAMQQAEPKLGVPNDAMRDAAIKLVTPDILISVELAGAMSVVEFNTWDDAELSLRPGLDGVAARLGGDPGASVGTLRAIFPSQMMLGNMLPHRAMGAATAIVLGEGGAAGALDDPKKLREMSGVRMYRFRVGQVVQAGVGGSPQIVLRGKQLMSAERAVGIADLRTMAADMAQHLLIELSRSSVQPGPDSLRVVDTGDIGTGHEHSLAAMALSSFASSLDHSPASESLRHSSFSAAATVLRNAYGHERPKGVVVVPAFSLLTFAELAARGSIEPRKIGEWASDFTVAGIFTTDRDRSEDFLRACVNECDRSCGSMFSLPAGFAREFPEQWRAPLCCAASRSPVGSRCRELAPAAIRRLFVDTPEAMLVAHMPWLGWAELELSGVKGDILAALALRHMREDCWKHQLSITDAGEDALDMAGGIIFTKGLSSGTPAGNPYPTWQCVRPLAFIATMLRDPCLTEPQERPEQIVRLMQAARFLRQLQVDEASAWMYPDPSLAIGGIRASTWDNALPVDATSMTLLFVVELIKSLDELDAAAKQQSPPAVPAPAK